MTSPTESGAEDSAESNRFDDAAAEMATRPEEGAQRPSRSDEAEVEAPVEGASAPAGIAEGSDDGSEPESEPEPRSAEAGDDLSELDWVVEDPDLQASDDAADPVTAQAPTADDQLLERTADLQRLSAEYANYRKRVERERQLVAENAAYKALMPVIEVLDTIDRAREHGELEGGFKSVAEQLERAVASSGLTRFGAPGDEFDPTLHEALSHIGEDPDVTVTTAKVIAKSGYKINDRVVRAAQVLVVDPAAPTE